MFLYGKILPLINISVDIKIIFEKSYSDHFQFYIFFKIFFTIYNIYMQKYVQKFLVWTNSHVKNIILNARFVYALIRHVQSLQFIERWLNFIAHKIYCRQSD